GDTGNSSSGGAHVVQSNKLRPRWKQIRGLIADCSDLLPEARQSLIAQGDDAATDNDCQRHVRPEPKFKEPND
ncbi:MAG: hypothetical protein ABGZ17_17605, partial [Planctomycetaceae bacterium]